MKILLASVNENVHDLQCEHLTKLLLSQDSCNKLFARHLSIFVDIHLSKGLFCDLLLAHLVLVLVLDLNEAIEVCDEPLHLFLSDRPVTVHVKHSEDLGKHILGSSIRKDVEEDHKLYEVNKAIIVGVVDAEDMLLHLVDLLLWESLGHHLIEAGFVELAIWIFFHELVKLLLNHVLRVPAGLRQGSFILWPQYRFSIF